MDGFGGVFAVLVRPDRAIADTDGDGAGQNQRTIEWEVCAPYLATWSAGTPRPLAHTTSWGASFRPLWTMPWTSWKKRTP